MATLDDPGRLDCWTHRELQRAAATLSTKNHIDYITEAAVVAKCAPDDPVAALEVLAAMQGSAYASRRHQKPALAEVGAWLEGYLHSHPDVSGERLASVLGWLRRLAMARLAGSPQQRADAPPNQRTKRFGDKVAELRRRHDAKTKQLIKVSTKKPNETKKDVLAPPDESTSQPTQLRVVCDNIAHTRRIWKVASKARRKGHPLKDERFSLRVVHPSAASVRPLAASFATTVGLTDVFLAFNKASGVFGEFHVLEWEDTPLVRLATRVTLDPHT